MATIVSLLLDGTCGDGIVDPGEECDDGNGKNGDCCSATCGFELAESPCGRGCDGKRCDGLGSCGP
jgi:cysteine-rich repeat protein